MEFLRLSLRRHSAGKPVAAWRSAGYLLRLLCGRVGPHGLLIFIFFFSASEQGCYIRYWAEGEACSWTAETHNEIYQWSQEDRKCENAIPSIYLLGFFCRRYTSRCSENEPALLPAPLVVRKYFTRSLRSPVKYFSTLEEKFRVSALPCNILNIFWDLRSCLMFCLLCFFRRLPS